MPPKKRAGTSRKTKGGKKRANNLKVQDAAKVTEDVGHQSPTDNESDRVLKRRKVDASSDAKELPEDAPISTLSKEKSIPTTDGASEVHEDPKLVGAFDVYAMELSFLHDVYSPRGKALVQPEELYLEMKKYQLKNDRTAKIVIPEDFETGEDGSFRSNVSCDPMEDLPFDIEIEQIEKVLSVELEADYARPKNAWDGPALEAVLTLEACGVEGAMGFFKMRPLWRKVTPSGVELELFEGSFSLNIAYSSLYERKGHGEGIDCPEVAFWAIRSA